MVIKRSSAREVAGLLRDLREGDEVAREAAVARLSVIGTRAVDGLLAVLASPAPSPVRLAALAALEAIEDPRAIEPAFALLLEADAAFTVPAVGVLRRALDSARGTEVLDRLTAVTLDVQRPDRARLAALEALQGLSPRTLSPIVRKLKGDSSAAIRAAVAGTGPMPEIDPLSAIEAASNGELPEDPQSVRRWLGEAGGVATLPILHRLIQCIRAREAETSDGSRRVGWMRARAAAHLVLAQRGSRVALYDLRETIEGGATAPVEMLSALETIGDRTCLEPIAAACARLSAPAGQPSSRTSPGRDTSAWWRQHLAAAFRAIAAREKVTERHAEVRRIRSRWPEIAIELLGPR